MGIILFIISAISAVGFSYLICPDRNGLRSLLAFGICLFFCITTIYISLKINGVLFQLDALLIFSILVSISSALLSFFSGFIHISLKKRE